MPFVIPLCKQPASSPGVGATGAGSICNKWAIKRQARSKRLASLRHGRVLSTAGLHSEHRSTVAILLNSQQAPFNGQLPSMQTRSNRCPSDARRYKMSGGLNSGSVSCQSHLPDRLGIGVSLHGSVSRSSWSSSIADVAGSLPLISDPHSHRDLQPAIAWQDSDSFSLAPKIIEIVEGRLMFWRKPVPKDLLRCWCMFFALQWLRHCWRRRFPFDAHAPAHAHCSTQRGHLLGGRWRLAPIDWSSSALSKRGRKRTVPNLQPHSCFAV